MVRYQLALLQGYMVPTWYHVVLSWNPWVDGPIPASSARPHGSYPVPRGTTIEPAGTAIVPSGSWSDTSWLCYKATWFPCGTTWFCHGSHWLMVQYQLAMRGHMAPIRYHVVSQWNPQVDVKVHDATWLPHNALWFWPH